MMGTEQPRLFADLIPWGTMLVLNSISCVVRTFSNSSMCGLYCVPKSTAWAWPCL